MNFFESSTLTWWQIGLVKLCLLCFGVAIGAYWSEIFLPYIGLLITIGVVLGIYLSVIWFSQN